MEAAELIEIISRGEDSRHQFKADVNDADSLAAEIVAFSNSGGGRMFICVSDDKKIVSLSAGAVGRINQALSKASSQNVRPLPSR
jgi:ATP-dependent DNA helicase RecG